ncbi:hypothetical protein ACWJKU_00795 [Methylocaldum sp. MU1018]
MDFVTPTSFSEQPAGGVRLQMSAVKLIELFENGNLHVEDFCCLDPPSKDLVKRLLLVSLNAGQRTCQNAEERFMIAESRLCADAAPPDSLQETLRFLLMRYARSPSPATAGRIAACLDGLLAHPRFKASPDERCTYRRMRSYWRLVENLG